MAPNLLYAAEFNHAKRIIRYNSPTIVRFDGVLPPAFMAAILRGLRSPDSLNEGQDDLWEEEPVVPEVDEVSNMQTKGPNKESDEVVANAAIRTGETEQLEQTVQSTVRRTPSFGAILIPIDPELSVFEAILSFTDWRKKVNSEGTEKMVFDRGKVPLCLFQLPLHTVQVPLHTSPLPQAVLRPYTAVVSADLNRSQYPPPQTAALQCFPAALSQLDELALTVIHMFETYMAYIQIQRVIFRKNLLNFAETIQYRKGIHPSRRLFDNFESFSLGPPSLSQEDNREQLSVYTSGSRRVRVVAKKTELQPMVFLAQQRFGLPGLGNVLRLKCTAADVATADHFHRHD
ncbi:hypothetical protein B0H14DRAFT_2633911 [Mycena olivaceomarginata]|nr:hypothetical protein B0H14DRAFT_2633911 [Mycena olivaceomarginata]